METNLIQYYDNNIMGGKEHNILMIKIQMHSLNLWNACIVI